MATKTDGLLSKYDKHVSDINEAKNVTDEILQTLASVAASAAMIEDANRSRWSGLGSGVGYWVPYIIGPVATLLLGSYGLAPSAMRNLGLVALGELVGFSVSNLHGMTMSWLLSPVGEMIGNATVTGL